MFLLSSYVLSRLGYPNATPRGQDRARLYLTAIPGWQCQALLLLSSVSRTGCCPPLLLASTKLPLFPQPGNLWRASLCHPHPNAPSGARRCCVCCPQDAPLLF
ncbi:hypothetical protein GDO81_021109 [Engystomops pustulosus]|uniref:Uncharacterized protein n=1 Tax=Engystomops pustulosus TaxID=76066 RepID=A0AAV6ZGG8_ENGPU|nr:hypothetical protein GDO81_021109 [Engystomops pustulosus]